MFYLYVLASILAGVSVVITRIFNARIAEESGTIESTYINYLTGLVGAIIFFAFSKEYFDLNHVNYGSIPIWAYFGGAVGVIVVVLSNFATPKVSSFSLSLIIFFGQLAIGIVIDFISYGEVSIGKLIGGSLILIGLLYNMKIEKDIANEKEIEVLEESEKVSNL